MRVVSSGLMANVQICSFLFEFTKASALTVEVLFTSAVRQKGFTASKRSPSAINTSAREVCDIDDGMS